MPTELIEGLTALGCFNEAPAGGRGMRANCTLLSVVAEASMRPRREAGECAGLDRYLFTTFFASMRPRREAGECRLAS